MILRLLNIVLVLALLGMPGIVSAQDSNTVPPGLGSASDPDAVLPDLPGDFEPADPDPVAPITPPDTTVPPPDPDPAPDPDPLLGPVIPLVDDLSGPPASQTRQGITNPLKNITSIPGFIEALFDRIVLPIGVSIAVLFIIYSGFLFVIAQGNEQKLTQAKSTFMWTIIGTAILLGSWAIAVLVKNTVEQLRADIPKHIVYEDIN